MAYGVAEHQSKPLLDNGIFILLSVVLGTTSGALVSGPTNKNVTVGQHVILPCSTDLDLPVFWYFNGHEIFYGGRVAMTFQTMFDVSNDIKGEYNLIISSADFSYNGEYICGDDEGQGERKSAHLYVTGRASVTVADMGSTTSGDYVNIPLIIGVVAGIIALLLVIVISVVCFRRNRASKITSEPPQEPDTRLTNQASSSNNESDRLLTQTDETVVAPVEEQATVNVKDETIDSSVKEETTVNVKDETIDSSVKQETTVNVKDETVVAPVEEQATVNVKAKIAAIERNEFVPANKAANTQLGTADFAVRCATGQNTVPSPLSRSFGKSDVKFQPEPHPAVHKVPLDQQSNQPLRSFNSVAGSPQVVSLAEVDKQNAKDTTPSSRAKPPDNDNGMGSITAGTSIVPTKESVPDLNGSNKSLSGTVEKPVENSLLEPASADVNATMKQASLAPGTVNPFASSEQIVKNTISPTTDKSLYESSAASKETSSVVSKSPEKTNHPVTEEKEDRKTNRPPLPPKPSE